MDDITSNNSTQYVFMRADKLRLLIPQTEVRAIGHLDVRPEPSGMPGLLAAPGRDDVCYLALSDDFRLLENCPEDRFVTTSLRTADDMETYWCWAEARVLLDSSLELHDIPKVLLNSASPVRSYALMDDRPVFVCDAETLQNLTLGALS